MKIVLNTHKGTKGFSQALSELADGAETLSVAVSYMQTGGWEGLKHAAKGLSLPNMRIVCTDQFGITQPTAVRRALDEGVQIKRFCGKTVYHPKVFLAHGRGGQATKFLIGSANLSTSAFSTSVEAGVIGGGRTNLTHLDQWFNHLFKKDAEDFTPAILDKMEVAWRLAATARIRARLRLGVTNAQLPSFTAPLEAEDVDALDDVLATIQSPIGLLNLDCARNYIRTIKLARKLLALGPPHDSKSRSEMRFLGLLDPANENQFSNLGKRATGASSDEEFARIWCGWLKHTPDAVLGQMNPRLVAAKRALRRFWQLKSEVRDFFLVHINDKKEKPVLQAIELLCNGGDEVEDLTLDEIRELSRLLWSKGLPAHLQREIDEYLNNKGTRGWENDDRRIIPSAWRQA